MVETWFDPEYKEFFYTREPLARFIDHGDISAQLKMKEEMKCKSFDWFMTEIAYDVLEKYPKLPPNEHWGEVRSEASGKCIDTFGRHPPQKTGTSGCHGQGHSQLLMLNTEGRLTSGEWCLKVMGEEVVLAYCDMGRVDGAWRFKEEDQHMVDTAAPGGIPYGRCLALHPDTSELVMRECDTNNDYHKWSWRTIKPSWVDSV